MWSCCQSWFDSCKFKNQSQVWQNFTKWYVTKTTQCEVSRSPLDYEKIDSSSLTNIETKLTWNYATEVCIIAKWSRWISWKKQLNSVPNHRSQLEKKGPKTPIPFSKVFYNLRHPGECLRSGRFHLFQQTPPFNKSSMK